MSFKLRLIATVAATQILMACGGGGSSGGSDPATTLTSTTSTTTTTTSTTSTTVPSTNYLYLSGDSIKFNDGYSTETNYTLTQFQSPPGITVKWPMYDSAALKFTLTDAGSFNIASGQTLSAAVAISDTAPGSQAVLKFYIDNVTVTKNGSDITLTVPNTAVAWVYGVLADGTGAALKNFNSSVINAYATIGTAPNTVSNMMIGSAINSAFNSVGSTGSMSGTYKVTLVVTNLPLSQANGTPLNTYQVDVPKSLGDLSSVKSTSGLGLQGYITLTAR